MFVTDLYTEDGAVNHMWYIYKNNSEGGTTI